MKNFLSVACVIFWLGLVTVPAVAQQGKAQETVPLTESERLEYRKLSLDFAQAQNYIDIWVSKNPELKALIDKRNKISETIAGFQNQLFKDHEKKVEEWSFSPQTLELVKREVPLKSPE